MNNRVAILALLVAALSASQQHTHATGLSSEGSADVALRDTYSTQDNSVSALKGAQAFYREHGGAMEMPLLKRPLYLEAHFNDRTEAAAVEVTEEAEERRRQEILEAQRLRIQSQLERSRGRW
ncbi:hypothetical protein EC968_004184 [Mortierella alpina]|nr:hypothetical protein EC968_004184 [Mortierella alpina]